MRTSLLLITCCLIAACTLLPDGSRWGAGATLASGWEQVGASAARAARSPWVWAPLACAAVLQIDSWDEDVAGWVSDAAPVFGSVQHAEDWSDGLRDASALAYAASVLATPSGGLDADWLAAKTRGGGVLRWDVRF